MSREISQSDALDALTRLRYYAQEGMAYNRPNTDAYRSAREDRDWADRIIRDSRA